MESRDFREETLFTSRREEGNEDHAHSTQHARTDKALNLCPKMSTEQPKLAKQTKESESGRGQLN